MTQDKYIVMCVFKEYGKKWYPLQKDDNPCWSLNDTDENKYRLLIYIFSNCHQKCNKGCSNDSW